MEPLSSLLYSNERKTQKRSIPIVKIGEADNEESLSPTVKREKIEATTPSIEAEPSTSADSLKDDGEIEDELHDLNATEVSNASNLTINGDVQVLKDLIQDILKKQSLVDAGTSTGRCDALNGSEVGNNNNGKEIIKAPDFQLEPTAAGGKRLVIFVSNDKTMCYKFYIIEGMFHCGVCLRLHHKGVRAKVIKDENGEDFVQMVHQHLCQPIKYVPPSKPQPHEIINAPNYEIQVTLNGRPKLVIFVPTNPNLCYYYQNKGKNNFACCECKKMNKKTTSAKLLKDQDDVEYVQANVPHLCEPVMYVANIWNIIKAPNFFVYQLNQRLVVFNLDHPNFCYRYNYNNTVRSYYCISCLNVHQKYVSAKVIKDVNGEECLQTNSNHLCEHSTDKISDFFVILKSPNFTLINDESNGSSSIFRVYASIDQSTVYNFTQMESSYACSGCLSKGQYFMAKLFKDETGEEVVLVLKDQQHVCVPITCG